jgi:hypothetical protein
MHEQQNINLVKLSAIQQWLNETNNEIKQIIYSDDCKIVLERYLVHISAGLSNKLKEVFHVHTNSDTRKRNTVSTRQVKIVVTSDKISISRCMTLETVAGKYSYTNVLWYESVLTDGHLPTFRRNVSLFLPLRLNNVESTSVSKVDKSP